jgi:hypothetical protein
LGPLGEQRSLVFKINSLICLWFPLGCSMSHIIKCWIWLPMVTDYWKGSETVHGQVAVLSHSFLERVRTTTKNFRIVAFMAEIWTWYLLNASHNWDFRFTPSVVEIFTFLWCYVALVVIYWKWTH